MKDILHRLTNHETLSQQEAQNVLINISKGQYNPLQIASFLTVFMMRSITVDELIGFRQALLSLCNTIDLSDYQTVDLCGTGGDGKDTFNISTLAAFVSAGAGIKVAKHGNYGVSSISGSSNVLEFLGIKFSNNENFLKESIENAGICILHAPLFHPAMKQVAPIRKDLAVKTFFNMLGPMVNPSFPKHQVVGVFSLELARMYTYLYQNTSTNFNIIHSLDGYDEISLTGNTKSISNTKETVINAASFNVPLLHANDIAGGSTIEENASIFTTILNGNGTISQQNVVCANAGIAIATVKNVSIMEGFELAKESLQSGKAKLAFTKLASLSKNMILNN